MHGHDILVIMVDDFLDPHEKSGSRYFTVTIAKEFLNAKNKSRLEEVGLIALLSLSKRVIFRRNLLYPWRVP